jgi:hypothetical protein
MKKSGGERTHRLRHDPVHDELRGGRGREGEGAPGGRPSAARAVAVELPGDVLGDGGARPGGHCQRRGRRGRGGERAGDVGRGRAPGPGQELQRVTRRLRRPEREVPAAARSPGAARVGHRSWRWRLLCAVRAVVSCVRGGRARKGGGEPSGGREVRWLLLGSGRFYRGGE